MNNTRVASIVYAATVALLFAVPNLAIAQEVAEGGAAGLNYSLIDLIKFGGWVGYIIILLSVAAVALVIEYAISIRPKVLIPEADIEELETKIKEGSYDEIVAKLKNGDTSFVATVVARGVKERDRGYDAVVKGMEDAGDELTGRLLRKIEHLNIIANISPMLGLLGTVMGMVNSFNQISVSVGGVDPRRLASGIFEALMTTVMGLIVAIPALYAFGLFRNRVDSVAASVAATAEDLVEPLKNGSREVR
jgi:biopolymer transport protein ExbB